MISFYKSTSFSPCAVFALMAALFVVSQTITHCAKTVTSTNCQMTSHLLCTPQNNS